MEQQRVGIVSALVMLMVDIADEQWKQAFHSTGCAVVLCIFIAFACVWLSAWSPSVLLEALSCVLSHRNISLLLTSLEGVS